METSYKVTVSCFSLRKLLKKFSNFSLAGSYKLLIPQECIGNYSKVLGGLQSLQNFEVQSLGPFRTIRTEANMDKHRQAMCLQSSYHLSSSKLSMQAQWLSVLVMVHYKPKRLQLDLAETKGHKSYIVL